MSRKQRVSNKIHPKRNATRFIVIKMTKVKDEKRTVKAGKENSKRNILRAIS